MAGFDRPLTLGSKPAGINGLLAQIIQPPKSDSRCGNHNVNVRETRLISDSRPAHFAYAKTQRHQPAPDEV